MTIMNHHIGVSRGRQTAQPKGYTDVLILGNLSLP
jgi:hypothetical protein